MDCKGKRTDLEHEAGGEHEEDVEGAAAEEGGRVDGGGARDHQTERGRGDARDGQREPVQAQVVEVRAEARHVRGDERVEERGHHARGEDLAEDLDWIGLVGGVVWWFRWLEGVY